MKFSSFVEMWIDKFYSEKEAKEHFITIPQFSSVLSLAILSKISREFDKRDISVIEIGAGDGELSYSISQHSEKFGINIKKITLVEKSEKRRENIRKKDIKNAEIVESLWDINEKADIIISNEFFDSLPFSIIKFDGGFEELFIEDSKPYFAEISESSKRYIEKYLKDDVLQYEKIFFEICELFPIYIKKISELSDFVIISDYGYRYFTQRLPYGSVILHWNFRTEKLNLDNPVELEKQLKKGFGEKDISFFVDFDVLEKIFCENHFKVDVKRLSSFIIENISDNQTANEILMKTENPISLIDVLTNWGNFFILTAKRF